MPPSSACRCALWVACYRELRRISILSTWVNRQVLIHRAFITVSYLVP